MIKNHRKPKGKEIPCASQEIGKKLMQPKTAQNIFMTQLQEQKRHLKLSLQVFSEAPTILMSRNDEMIQSYKINYMPTGDTQGLDGEMLPQWSSSPRIPNKDNFARTASLLLQFFQTSVLLLVMTCLIVQKNVKTTLTFDTTVINACAIRNGSVSGVPYSKQSFMRERPFFPQNRQTQRSKCNGTSTSQRN